MADADKLRDANPWHPITDTVDLKHLGKLIEELNECIEAAAWCQTYGVAGNKLWQEIADVDANIDLCTGRFALMWEGLYARPVSSENDDAQLVSLIAALARCGCAVSRVIIQGIDECEPVTFKRNRLWFEEAVAQVKWEIRSAIQRFGFDKDAINARASKKKSHLRQWHALA